MSKLIALVSFATLTFTTPALSWNKAGHMVSGAIAYAELQRIAPQSVPRVITLLKQHPYYNKWQPQLDNVPEAERNLYLFMLAAKWADDARRDPSQNRPTWHYVNLPFTLGSTANTIPANPTGENILTALAQNRSILETPGTTPKKAISLTWIFHLMGDLHQPLHTTKAVSTQFPLPKGDLGGNSFFIRAKEGRSTIKLHTFWDALILGSERFQSVRNEAIALRQNANYQRDNLPELADPSIDAAKTESYKLAPQVYKNLQSGTENDGKVLPEGYADTAKSIAQKRVVLAGYRLADYLKAAF